MLIHILMMGKQAFIQDFFSGLGGGGGVNIFYPYLGQLQLNDLSYMKLIKTHIRNSVTGLNLGRLMKIAIEGPELSRSSRDFQ